MMTTASQDDVQSEQNTMIEVRKKAKRLAKQD